MDHAGNSAAGRHRGSMARVKVTGAARYGADMAAGQRGLCFSRDQPDRQRRASRRIDERTARAVPGVLDDPDLSRRGRRHSTGQVVLAGRLSRLDDPAAGVGQGLACGRDRRDRGCREFRRRRARRAHASRHRVTPQQRAGRNLRQRGRRRPSQRRTHRRNHEDPQVGDAEQAFAASDGHDRCAITRRRRSITIRSNCSPRLCAWDGGRPDGLGIDRKTSTGFRHGLAEQLGMAPNNIRVISPYVGGAFGSRGSLTHAHGADRRSRPGA